MEHFTRILDDIDVSAACDELDLRPDLWNQHRERSVNPASPHRETSDIWLRYCEPEKVRDGSHLTGPFEMRWYPAWFELPALHPIYHQIAMAVKARECGGVLITRIGPAMQVYPHHDRGGWHPEHFTTKVFTILRANPLCLNVCDNEMIVMQPGSAWAYDNLKFHSVMNAGPTERLCLISCFRCADE
jgi:hypothetical protein